jgi:hypothetical protein
MQAIVDQRGLTEWPCRSCGETFPAEKYKSRGPKAAGGKAPRHTMCNRCLYLRYTQPHAARKTLEVQAYKVEQGCVDCGYNDHPAALEFDHLPGEDKLFNIGEKLGVYKPETIWAEIAKCEVVCANCHAIRTTTRRQEAMLS